MLDFCEGGTVVATCPECGLKHAPKQERIDRDDIAEFEVGGQVFDGLPPDVEFSPGFLIDPFCAPCRAKQPPAGRFTITDIADTPPIIIEGY